MKLFYIVNSISRVIDFFNIVCKYIIESLFDFVDKF